MSCKYCKPLQSTGDTEPLLVLGDNCKCSISGNVLTLKCYGMTAKKTVDFCPNCGEALTPFGPSWGHSFGS